jgi:hypothetical protein
MTKRITFSNKHLELNEIFDYYYTTNSSIRKYLNDIKNRTITIEAKFVGMNNLELKEYFNKMLKELEFQVSFNIISSIEAKFMMDYHERVLKRKPKNDLTKEFRKLNNSYKKKSIRVSLEDIINLWKKYYPVYKNHISQYKTALNFRNWFAHGRYWYPKLGRQHTVDDISIIAEIIDTNFPFCI